MSESQRALFVVVWELDFGLGGGVGGEVEERGVVVERRRWWEGLGCMGEVRHRREKNRTFMFGDV